MITWILNISELKFSTLNSGNKAALSPLLHVLVHVFLAFVSISIYQYLC